MPNFQAQQGANGRKLLHLHSCQIHMCLLSLRKDMKNEVRMVEVIPAPVLAQHITARAPCSDAHAVPAPVRITFGWTVLMGARECQPVSPIIPRSRRLPRNATAVPLRKAPLTVGTMIIYCVYFGRCTRKEGEVFVCLTLAPQRLPCRCRKMISPFFPCHW